MRMKMMLRTMTLITTLLTALSAQAQQLEVVSLQADLRDNSAWSPATRRQLPTDSTRYCPIVKVEFLGQDLVFEGALIGESTFKTNEYWVYMNPGAYHLVIKHPDYEKLDVLFAEVNPDIKRLQSKTTYILKLKGQPKKGIESIEEGEATALLKQAQNYEQGKGAYQKDLEQALIWYEKAAEGGSEEAQLYLAYVLSEGMNGFPKDAEKALHWNEKCAGRGEVESMLRAARLCEEKGRVDDAVRWYAAYDDKQPSADMEMHIVGLYSNHPERQEAWLRKAASNGSGEAMYRLAKNALPTDVAEATRYYDLAMAAGHVKAMEDYGCMLLYGQSGIAQNEEQAREVLGKAIRQNSSTAQLLLDGFDLKQKQNRQLAAYIDKVPALLEAVRQGDGAAAYQCYLIYLASGDNQMATRMRIVTLYNHSYGVPLPSTDDAFLYEQAGKPVIMRTDCMLYRYLIDHVLENTDGANRNLLELFANQYHEKGCLDYLLSRGMVREYSITTQFEYISTQRYREMVAADATMKAKDRKKLLAQLDKRLAESNITDAGTPFMPWFKAMKDDGLLWNNDVAGRAVEAADKMRAEQERIRAEKKRKQMEEAQRTEQQKKMDAFKERVRKHGGKTIAANGVSFNMILVRPNVRARFSDFNSGGYCMAPRTSFYMSEALVTTELWNAVMYDVKKENVLQDVSAQGVKANKKDILSFIEKLNKMTGMRFRLPTIEEFEYVGHEGVSGNYMLSARYSAPKPEKGPNKLGFFDCVSNCLIYYPDQKNYFSGMYDAGLSTTWTIRLVLPMTGR